MEARDLVAGLAPVCVFVMMACIGLDLVPAQFRALLRAPKPLLVGIAGQLLVAPAAGFALAAHEAMLRISNIFFRVHLFVWGSTQARDHDSI